MPDTTKTSESSDESCAKMAVQGSIPAFEILVHRYESKLLSFLSLKTGNKQDAEDLLQNTFLKAYHKLNTFDLSKRFSTWIYAIAYHELISHIRKRRPEIELTGNDEAYSPFPLKSLWNELKALLDDKDYVLLWLHYGAGYSIKEVGEIIDKKESAVKTALHRLRNKIPGLLAKDGILNT